MYVPIANSPEEVFHSHFRNVRLQLAKRVFRDVLSSSLSSLPSVVLLGDDPFAAHLIDRVGGDSSAIAIRQILVDDMPITVLGVQRKTWFRSVQMAKLNRAVHKLKEHGRRCLVIPETAIAGAAGLSSEEVLSQLLRTTEVPDCICCKPKHRHDPIGCFGHFLGTGINCNSI